MVIEGEIIDRASTEVRGAGGESAHVRPVHTGIAFFEG